MTGRLAEGYRPGDKDLLLFHVLVGERCGIRTLPAPDLREIWNLETSWIMPFNAGSTESRNPHLPLSAPH